MFPASPFFYVAVWLMYLNLTWFHFTF
ncbi:rCG51232, isoform CRA_a [Rattus norvegicus]|uniref:RCG51232, isoform CRA_a n=1 Tax=Rattus norvegicus TaxID=10116 RepID=A6IZA9_RAT|nr:rCG51232, isoform CRA_a [Rattus norvegicus]